MGATNQTKKRGGAVSNLPVSLWYVYFLVEGIFYGSMYCEVVILGLDYVL